MHRRHCLLLLGLCLWLPPIGSVCAGGAPKTQPLSFSAKSDAAAKKAVPLPASGWIYGHTDFAAPLKARMEKAPKLNAVVKLFKGDQQLTSWRGLRGQRGRGSILGFRWAGLRSK